MSLEKSEIIKHLYKEAGGFLNVFNPLWETIAANILTSNEIPKDLEAFIDACVDETIKKFGPSFELPAELQMLPIEKREEVFRALFYGEGLPVQATVSYLTNIELAHILEID